MQERITVEISLFGAFRELAEPSLCLELPRGATISDVRAALKEAVSRAHPQFKQKNLFDVSPLADETTILRNQEVLLRDTKLAIIPPISGG